MTTPNPKENELSIDSILEIKIKFEQEDRKMLREMGEIFGIKIFLDPSMRPNEWKIVCGVDAYTKMVSPVAPYLKGMKQ